MRKTKILLSRINNLIDLLEESENIFFEERPFLLNPLLEIKIKPLDERRSENELKIKKTNEATGSKLADKLSEETHEPKQKGIFRMA